jgi:hypothetical protein
MNPGAPDQMITFLQNHLRIFFQTPEKQVSPDVEAIQKFLLAQPSSYESSSGYDFDRQIDFLV